MFFENWIIGCEKVELLHIYLEKVIIFTNKNYDIIAFSKVKIVIQIRYIQEVIYILNKII